MVGVFGHQHMDQRLARDAVLDQPLRRAPVPAAQVYLGRRVTITLELRRDHVEPFRDILADARPPQQAQVLSAMSITISSRGRCAGSAPRLAEWPRVEVGVVRYRQGSNAAGADCRSRDIGRSMRGRRWRCRRLAGKPPLI